MASSGASKNPSDSGAPERALGRDPDPPRPALITAKLLQHDEGSGRASARHRRPETQLSETGHRPSGRRRPLVRRRLAHHQPAPRLQKPDRTFGRDGRRPERAGQDPVESLPQVRTAGRLLGAGLDDDDTGQPQGPHRLAKELGCPLPGFEQGQLQPRSLGGHDQAGKAATAAEVEHPALAGGQPRQEGSAMLDVTSHRPGAEKALGLRPEKNFFEIGGGQEELARALMTTRRRGSSPSEMVATPSISFTMSWTTFRSAGDIGSKAWSRPDSIARWAA